MTLEVTTSQSATARSNALTNTMARSATKALEGGVSQQTHSNTAMEATKRRKKKKKSKWRLIILADFKTTRKKSMW